MLRVQKTQQKHEKSLAPSYSPDGFGTYTIVCTKTEKGQRYKEEFARMKKTIILAQVSLLSLGRSVALENESSLSYAAFVSSRPLCQMQSTTVQKEFVSVNKELEEEHSPSREKRFRGMRTSLHSTWSAQLLCK